MCLKPLSFKYFLAYVHICDEKLVTGEIQEWRCQATITIYSPLDPTIRKAIIIPGAGLPHNHPSFPLQKLTIPAKKAYMLALTQAGVTGATVGKVDHGK